MLVVVVVAGDVDVGGIVADVGGGVVVGGCGGGC